MLCFPDFSQKFYISVDASNYAVGGYISNSKPPNHRPIEYFSKTLNQAQINYSTTHKELLAIILSIDQFRNYIWGKQFVLYTDHQALVYLFNQCKPGSRLLRWKIALSEYSFEILHRKGSNNTVNDCLSRIVPNASSEISHFIQNSATRAFFQAITRRRAKEIELIKNDTPNMPAYHIHEEPNSSFDIKKYGKIYEAGDEHKAGGVAVF